MTDTQDEAFALMLNKAAGLMNYNFMQQADQVEALLTEVVKDHAYFNKVKVKQLFKVIAKATGVTGRDLGKLLKDLEYKHGKMNTTGEKRIGRFASMDKAFARFLNENKYPIMTRDQIKDHIVTILRVANGDFGDERMRGLPYEFSIKYMDELCKNYLMRPDYTKRPINKQISYQNKKVIPWVLDEKYLGSNKIRIRKELDKVLPGASVYGVKTVKVPNIDSTVCPACGYATVNNGVSGSGI
jgi:hypothetical protein